MAVCIIGFYLGYSLENATTAANIAMSMDGQAAYDAIYEPARRFSQGLFWLLAIMVGTSQGGVQALSRSQFSRMIPPERSNEFFGFFDIFGKFATMVGPFLYALLASLTGRSSFGVLSLILLFIIGIVVLFKTPKIVFEKSYYELNQKKDI
jgi:MFS transporter, UMF1 family